MSARTSWVRAAALPALAVAFLSTAACASGKMPDKPAFPTDPDPAAGYCLVWVPPVYRNVPCVAPVTRGGMEPVVTSRQKVVFSEVCTPAVTKEHCVPDRCRDVGFVQVKPARQEWRQVACGGPGCPASCECWRSVTLPPEHKLCPATKVDQGYAYCTYTPPKYDVVAKTVCTKECGERYVPPEYEVGWRKELFQPGHWAWQRRYDCAEVALPPARKNCSFDESYAGPYRGNFRTCPPAD